MLAATPPTFEEPSTPMKPWVLIVAADEANALSARAMWEEAGFAAEVVPTLPAALACLAVMTPAVLVVEGKLERHGFGGPPATTSA